MKKENNKKNKYINIVVYCANISLLVLVFFFVLSTEIHKDTVKGNTYTKKLSTSIIAEVSKNEEKKEDVSLDNSNEIQEEKQESRQLEETKKEKQKEEVKNTVVEEVIAKPAVPQNPTYSGTMSFYNANCTSCSGITATGVDVSDGRLYYNDKTYGNVRIVAAGTEIKKWSIIKIRNSSLANEVLAIVLDRGGDIGVGRKFIIDMLTNSTENKSGINKNIEVEVLRNGK